MNVVYSAKKCETSQ